MSKDNQAVANRPNRQALAETGKKIDGIRAGYEQELVKAGNDYERACILACSLIDLRQAVKEYWPVLAQLQGSKLGFRTDKDRDGGYGQAVVIDCAIEAIMRGARWNGNEWNIIAGGCYLTKEYWWRKVREVEGLTDLDLNPDVPEFANGKCVVTFQASWRLDGRACQMTRRIPIIVRNNQSDDATLGKAEARMLKMIHRKVTGTETTDADDDEPKVVPLVKPAAQGNGQRPAIEAPKLAEGEVPNEDDGAQPFDWNAAPEDVERERERLNATK